MTITTGNNFLSDDIQTDLFSGCRLEGGSAARCVAVERCLAETDDYEDLTSVQEVVGLRKSGSSLDSCPTEEEVCCKTNHILPEEKVQCPSGVSRKGFHKIWANFLGPARGQLH